MHREWHRSDRIGWLRATVLGANDGLISTSDCVNLIWPLCDALIWPHPHQGFSA